MKLGVSLESAEAKLGQERLTSELCPSTSEHLFSCYSLFFNLQNGR